MNSNTLSFSENGEARILLTDRCNYRCIFCHNEGSEVGQTNCVEDSADRLRFVLDQLLECGCRDITFTGGEPLLKQDLLLDLLRHIRKKHSTVPVTIVTNGSLLKSDWVDAVAKLGGVRFNISLHTVDSADYARVTAQSKISLNMLGEKLQLLQNAQVPFKLNAVALRSTFLDSKALMMLIEYARSVGANSLKIIELLIVEKNQNFFDEHLALDTVEKWFPSSWKMIRRFSRGTVYSDGTLQVELRKCRCHFGCKECLRTQKTDSFDAAGRYWSCFERTEDARHTYETDFKKTLKTGRRVLGEMYNHYGEESPSLVKQLKMIPSKREAWFDIHQNHNIDTLLMDSEPTHRLNYTGLFFEPEFLLPSRTLPSVHIRSHQNDPENARLIIAYLSIKKEQDILIHETRFFDAHRIPMKGDTPFLQKTLSALGWSPKYSADANETHYKTEKGLIFSLIKINSNHRLLSVDTSTLNGISFASKIKKELGLKMVCTTISEHIKELLSD